MYKNAPRYIKKNDYEASQKVFRRCRVNGDGFPNVANSSRWFAEDPEALPNQTFGVQTLQLLKFGCRSFFDPEVPRRFPEVSSIAKTCRNPDLANSAFGNPSGGVVYGRYYEYVSDGMP